ncbi:hypothetical protein HY837_04290 [archaeon]|nr:hypothetical protein [archaeon]
MSHKSLFLIVFFLSFFGLILSSYLLYIHYQPSEEGFCLSFDNSNNCDIVNKGPFSDRFGCPIAGIGLLGYISFITVSLIALHKNVLKNTWLECHSEKSTSYLLYLALGALAFTIYFNYLQIFIIGLICTLCEVSATIVVILLTLSIIIKNKEINHVD